tara:strand:+ start:404 stop:829 length:426 start_codon:yes stop_codon:yes gene_type:complete
MELPKKLIPDANILFSFFKIDSTRRHVFRELLKHDLKFLAPKLLIEEILSEKDKIIKFAHIGEKEFSQLFTLLYKQIEKLDNEEFSSFLAEAAKLSPHDKDAPYFALALSHDLSIWSDEKAFKKQDKVKIFSTKDLLSLLR